MRFADYSQVVTASQLADGLHQGGFGAVCHYLGDDFALRIEDPLIVYDIRARGWPQMGIFVPRLASVDGAADGRRALQVYLFPARSLHWLDIEPGEFDANPGGWAAAADRWCDAIRAAGLSPGIYGVDRTVAACANHADVIWRAKPGQCDPAGAGLPDTFFAGHRAVQCGQGVWNGVAFDVSYSQFSIGGTMTRGDWIAFYRMWMFATGRPPALTPVGNYDDQFWADHTLQLIQQLGEEAGQAKAVDDFRADYAVDNGVYPGHPGPKGDAGPAGPAGPPGPATYVRHIHDAKTDTGTPA